MTRRVEAKGYEFESHPLHVHIFLFFLNMLLKVLLVNDHATGTDDNNNYI